MIPTSKVRPPAPSRSELHDVKVRGTRGAIRVSSCRSCQDQNNEQKNCAANGTSACLFHLPPVLDGDENTGPRRCLPCVVLDKIKSKSPIVLLERTTHDAYRLSPGVSRSLPESPGGGRAFE